MNLVLLGPPGTGKGTIAQFLETRFGLKHLSTGDALRSEVKNNTPLGKKIASTINAGIYVDDATVADIVESAIGRASGKKGIVFDGYPRTLEQAKKLGEILEKKGIALSMALYVATDDEEVVKRLSSRRQCTGCNTVYGAETPPQKEGVCDSCGSKLGMRDDDKPDVVRERLGVYKKQTAPIIDYYRAQGILVEVNGNPPTKTVLAAIEKVIAKQMG